MCDGTLLLVKRNFIKANKSQTNHKITPVSKTFYVRNG